MKIKTNVKLRSFDGEVLKDNDGKGNVIDATLKNAIVNALLAPLGQGKAEIGTDKVKKFDLAQQIYNNDEVELTVEEVTLIKERVGEVFGAIVVGQVFNLLEGKD